MENTKIKTNNVEAVAVKKHVDYENLNAIEAVSMTVVAILAVTLGTIYGSIL